MEITVSIKRQMSKEQVVAVEPYLSRLKSLALAQPGYMSGRRLINHSNPQSYLILCSWASLEDWERFNRLDESKELHYLVDQILVKPTQHSVYIDSV